MKLASILRFLAFLAVILLLPCCTGLNSGSLGKTLVTLSSIGLQVAAARGDLPPGTAVRIMQGYAILTTPGSTEEKVVSFAELGLNEAVAQGKLSPGDELIIRNGLAELKTSLATQPAPQAIPIPETATK